MTAHGTDPDLVDVETFHDICLMYADGFIGNHGVMEVLGALTGAVYNYMRKPNGKVYKLQDIIPRAYPYIYRPVSPEEQAAQAQDNLKAFALAKAPKGMFKG